MARRLSPLVPFLAALALVGVPALPAQAAGPQLHVSILVDRMAARPGDVIHYEIRVENVGDADAGVVQVTSHYPEQTTAASQNCPQGMLEPDGDVCLAPDLAAPGLGDSAHQVNHSRGGVGPGAVFSVRFAVRVNADAIVGSHLRNHAHASSTAAGQVTSAPVDTLVVGALPHGAFGATGVSLSGQVDTDGWDSSSGTLAQTERATGGDVASNGDILLSGAALVNGDATPGPGHAVLVSNTAQVTGSTAPAAAAVVVNTVDAAPYAGNNDNHRICRAPGSCRGTTFDFASKTLVVTESAVLPTGAYYLCRLDVSGVLTIAGNVALWFGAPEACGGQQEPVRLASTGTVTIASGHTGDLQLRIQGSTAISTAVRVTSYSALTAVLYDPASTLFLEGHAQFLGAATCGALAWSGQGLVHVDRAVT